MHRTFQQPWLLLGGLVACCWLLVGSPPTTTGQTCTPEKRPLVVLLNSTARLRMSTAKPIKTVVNPKEGLLTIRAIERDPTMIVLQGIAPGVTCLELEDADGFKECKEVIVQADVEYLTRQIHCGVPMSNIQVIPNGTNSVILAGFVNRAEDVGVAQAIASSVGFQVINGLRLSGVQQVQLDVVIARVERNKQRFFGFNFIGNARNTIYGSTVGNVIPALSPVGVPSSQVQPTFAGQILNSAPGSANLFTGVITNAGGFIGFLQALEVEGLAKVLAQPRLVTLSGNPASFLDGGEQAVPVPAGLGQVGVQFEEFGTRLNFLPIVLGNGRIHLEVEPEVSALSAANGVSIQGTVVPGRVTQRVHTTVEMETGQTFVIGGLIQRLYNATANKVPVLGEIPFVGALFSSKSVPTENEVELVVLITPHLVDAQSACQVAKVLPGQETRRPDDFELFLEGILEAPRGPRAVFHGNRYVPAHLTGPTANLFPCAGRGDGLHQQPASTGGWGQPGGGFGAGCPGGSCGASAPLDLTTPVGGGSMNGTPQTAPLGTTPAPLPQYAPAGVDPVPAASPVAPPEPPGGSLSARTPISLSPTPVFSGPGIVPGQMTLQPGQSPLGGQQ